MPPVLAKGTEAKKIGISPRRKSRVRILYNTISNMRNNSRYVTLCGITHLCDPCPSAATSNQHRYIRAFEVGQSPTSSKYELAVRLRTTKNGPVVRNRLRFPHPVDSSIRIAVICPPDSRAAAQATRAGACLVGEDNIIDVVKDGRIEFDRCLCHVDSVSKMNKAGLGIILGPRGLMPSTKLGTVVKDVVGSVRAMVGGSEYREKLAVIRLAVGQLGFTPEEMQRNIKAFMEGLKKDIAQLSDQVDKQIHEVVSQNIRLREEWTSCDS